jgi:hypothetical protein
MYDIDGDGFITKSDILGIMTALNKLTGNLTTHSEKVYYSVDQAVCFLFLELFLGLIALG